MIYLDYNATTPVAPEVVEAMLPTFTDAFGNASSRGHAYGWAADEAVQVGTEQVAALLGCDPRALTFTSGATEALNLAIKGVAAAYTRRGRHIVTVATEHKAVLDTCKALEREGTEVTVLPVDARGLVDADAFADALRDDTVLAAVMWANNETGVIQDVPGLAAIARARGVLFLSDATQAVGKIPVDARAVDLMACSAHKFYGPKGVGALCRSLRSPRVRLVPHTHGGGQQDGLRGGTLNTPGIAGMGAAAAMAARCMEADAARLEPLRDAFEARLRDALDGVHVNGGEAPRLPQTSNVAFEGVKAAALVAALRELAMSTGSACSSGTGRPSHVLTAMGLPPETALSSLRISLGRGTTAADVELAAERIAGAVQELRAAAAV